jgi:hypothetical protein
MCVSSDDCESMKAVLLINHINTMEVIIMIKPSKAKQIMKSVLDGNNVPFLLGGTGVGKSAVVKQLADDLASDRKVVIDEINPKKDEFGFIDFRLSLYESVDLGGLPYIDESNAQKRAFLGNLPTGGEGVLFFDEYAQAHPSVQAVVGQLIYERRLGEYVLPTGWKLICAGNRASDRAGSNKLPSHVIGRCSIINFEHDFDDWSKWATENEVHPYVMGFLSFQPNSLNIFDAKISEPQASPRSWTRLSDTLKTNPSKDLYQTIATCDVGELQAIEFVNFISLMEDVPNLTDILKGKDVDIVDDAGICYATCIALLDRVVNAKDKEVHDFFENALAYVRKFPTVEFAIFFVRQAVARREELKDSSVYGSFKVEHSNVEY